MKFYLNWLGCYSYSTHARIIFVINESMSLTLELIRTTRVSKRNKHEEGRRRRREEDMFDLMN